MAGLTEINTFWKLINNHRVEIPIIQRDYAQGREATTDPKAEQIRKAFVSDLVKQLEGSKMPMHLDFVYGKIKGRIDKYARERNSVAIDGLLKSVRSYSETLDISVKYEIDSAAHKIDNRPFTTFVPLDGQQRLTTLYLLHWYLLTRTGKDKSVLLNFSYKTRTSSISFCNALTNSTFSIILPDASGEKKVDELSIQISDSAWFFSYWRKDPTVKGMLNMLDEIHSHLVISPTEQLSKMLSLLTQTETITFDFLDMERFELTDDLYVKMNARGKQLTDFENFKTWLQEYVKQPEYTIDSSDWQKKFDIQWADLFWKFKSSKSFSVDMQYLMFFNFMALNLYSEKLKVSDSKINSEAVTVFEEFRKTDFIPLSRYAKLEIFSASNLNQIFSILDVFEKNGVSILEEILSPLFPSVAASIFDKLFGEGLLDLNLWDRCYLFSITRFLYNRKKNLPDYDADDKKSLFQWARITKNLIYNSNIDSPADFVSAQIAVNKLLTYHSDLYSYFAKGTLNEIPFLAPNQILEEEVKSKLILQDEAWEDLFIQAENHVYFYGQIGFLLRFSTKGNITDINDFRQYSSKAQYLFSDEILQHENLILQRALLTKGNYLIESGSNFGFCLPGRGTVRLREENWRRLLRNTKKSRFLKEVILDERPLDEIIAESIVEDWRSVFIEIPKCIKYCSQRLLKIYDSGQVVLLKQSQLNHYHADLYSYALFVKLEKAKKLKFEPFRDDLKQHDVKTSTEQPCLRLENWEFKNSLYSISIYALGTGNNFRLEFLNEEAEEINLKITEILADNKFTGEGPKFNLFSEGDAVPQILEDLCGRLTILSE